MATDSTGRGVMRIAGVLNCFTVEEPVHNLTAISKRIGLAKSTTHRLISTLVGQGFLMRDAQGRGYRLGYQMLQWGMVAHAGLDLRNEALPILRELCNASEETAILTVRDGTRCLCLEIVESSQPVRLTMLIGQRRHLHAGASSKVLLAFLPEAEIEHILSAIELSALTPNTITDPARLRAELATICQRGYATSFEETDRGAMGIAAPVYDHTGQAVAGICVAAPLTRIPPERVPEVAPLVVNASRQLSARLGAASPDARRRA
jgi:IclR family transcriptional regulator, KDG regulon repressor